MIKVLKIVHIFTAELQSFKWLIPGKTLEDAIKETVDKTYPVKRKMNELRTREAEVKLATDRFRLGTQQYQEKKRLSGQ